jgi:hypothetical protein
MIKYQVVPFIKTNEYNIVSVSTKVIQVNLGSSATISVGFLTDIGQWLVQQLRLILGIRPNSSFKAILCLERWAIAPICRKILLIGECHD